jgi:hypothetical protein
MIILVQRRRASIKRLFPACVLVIILLTHVSAFCSVGAPSARRCMMTQLNNNSGDGNNDDVSAFNQLKISFVTGNDMKEKEMNLILAKHMATKGPDTETSLVDLKVLSVDLPEIQEVSTEAIAKNKAYQASQLANGPVVVEDTSLEFVALGGMPG